ncbi:MAG: phosphoadenylyl-sulfate reductase [Bacteroidales bacterium]|jgi:phosphoadenosine phosphosulfate reductase|nr:phosphoadenylyl-sulfate reductase [Bacteroidales bacterium]MDY0198036.1 phosphoadenylyl-sulfate reductase [Tenuifilaceae bacterium]
MSTFNNKVIELNQVLKGKTPQESISHCLKVFGNKIALSTSLGIEDQVLTQMLIAINKEAEIFTLDTGRLFPETYDLIERTCSKYGINIKIFFPNHADVEEMVNKKGINLFYHSVANRKECCDIRKIRPLKRAFAGLDAWICGLRRDQSVTRSDMQLVEWDEANGLIKINPLIDWSEEDVWEYARENNVPYNILHDKGFPSIGCQPCTRAIEPGEDVRAGRWWWENPETKECGLHKR